MTAQANPLRWVLLLLIAAVIVPTVCLLWFMNQAVRNERLAVQQKLIDVYSKKAQRFFVEVPDLFFAGKEEHLRSYPLNEPRNFFQLFAAGPDRFFQGMLIYAPQGELLYPPLFVDTGENPADKPFADKSQETIELAYLLSYPDGSATITPGVAARVMRSRVFLAQRFLETADQRLVNHLRRSLGGDFLPGPAETTAWHIERLVAIANQAGLAQQLANEIQTAQNYRAVCENAVQAALAYPSAAALDGWPDQTIRKLPGGLDLYGFKLNVSGQTLLGIAAPEQILTILTASVSDMQDEMIRIQVSDNLGNIIAGEPAADEKPFLKLTAGKFMPDFAVSFYFRDSAVFEKAAHRQTSLYTWTGVLVAGLVTVTGVTAIRAVGRQIRMNRLKNDFIATVTHELKTPLASMRLLVDTLLEKRCPDEATAAEYLQMIAGENKRLTHLIDNFLTFSRMERNKQVFDLQPIAPADIALAAADAVKTKFANTHCGFTCTIDDNLPPVNADQGAMITVLVNLLDNACKYTGADKQIDLRVVAQNGSVCFAVTDNGIGIPRRAQKKIFNRFYQVDSRLSRSVEGCGLGLSIVKFIVTAHKGKIDVQSAPCKGSVFTVTLESCKR